MLWLNIILPFFLTLFLIYECLAQNIKNPLLVISLDGLRADKLDEFIKENPSSTFKRISDNGLKADYMVPIFPSSTFPNHFTLVTGVYAETHGIVGNQIYDPTADLKINFLEDPISIEARWWNNSEPIWLTAKNKGLKTGTVFWPGSYVWSRTADIWLSYSPSFSFSARVDEIINLYSKFNLDFANLYFSEPDSAGHSFGPDSQNYKDMIPNFPPLSLEQNTTATDYSFCIEDKKYGWYNCDHGMANSKAAPILVTDYVDTNLIDMNRSIFNYVSNVYPKSMTQLSDLYDALTKVSNTSVYYKKDIPASYYFSKSDRIAPILAVSDEGYFLTTDKTYQGIPGIHGYNNTLESMRTIFLAMGPSFKKASVIKGFNNINVYSLMCKLINIEPNPNNGTWKIFEPYLNSASYKLIHVSYFNYFIFSLKFFLVFLFCN